jgi:hypothetical protein
LTRLEQVLTRLGADLQKLQVHWALVGGLAVSALAEPRTTRDVDLAVATRDDTHAEDTVRSLCGDGYRLLEQLENVTSGRLATVRLLAPGEAMDGGIVVDLFFDYSGVETEMIERAEILSLVPGLEAPVVQRGDLLALKVLAARPRDLEDARALVKRASATDLRLAEQTLAAISGLGVHRHDDLLQELRQVVAAEGAERFRG